MRETHKTDQTNEDGSSEREGRLPQEHNSPCEEYLHTKRYFRQYRQYDTGYHGISRLTSSIESGKCRCGPGRRPKRVGITVIADQHVIDGMHSKNKVNGFNYGDE